MNTLHIDIEPGTHVILKESAMAAGYKDITWRVFRAEGGFGMRHETIGSAVFGVFVRDGEEARMEGYHIERTATPAEIDAAIKEGP
jgi:hypothetical protein